MTKLFGAVTPVFKIDGRLVGDLARDLSRLEIDEATDGMKTLMLRLVATGPKGKAATEQLLYLDGETIDFGRTIEVSIGPTEGARVVFQGTISAIEAAFSEGMEPHVVVFAEDELMKLRLTRRMKTYENQSDADIAKAIAGEHGLRSDVAADGPTYAAVQQWNQSDLAFLRARARLIQAEVWLDRDTLCFKTRGERTGTEITLVQGNHLIDVQIRGDLSHQRSAVKVGGYDAQSREAIDEEAGSDVIQAEISDGRTGPSILERAFGARVSHRVRESPLQSGEASAWAKAEMLRRCRGFVTVVGTANGVPDMIVGSRLTLERVGTPFNGEGYYATRVCHTYDLINGHRTHFEAERATVNGAS